MVLYTLQAGQLAGTFLWIISRNTPTDQRADFVMKRNKKLIFITRRHSLKK
jgi:hypothetical protein